MDTVEESKKLTSSQLRKIKKPLIEKRRRERINDSLSQLKSLILEALNKDENQYNKMEKADILELTVKHLKNLMSHQKAPARRSTSRSPESSNHDVHMQNSHDVHIQSSSGHIQNYTAGFVHCVSEVQQYMDKTATVQQDIKNHLSNHLNARIQDMPASERVHSPPPQVNGYVQILPKDTVVLGTKDASPTSPTPGVQCVHSLPILNGQTLVLTNPIQGLHSPSCQPMIQLTQPLMTYIPQQQIINNNNNNVTMKTDQLMEQKLITSISPRLPVSHSVSLCSQPSSQVSSVQTVTVQNPVNNRNVRKITRDVPTRCSTSVSSNSGSSHNLNTINRNEVPSDVNCNETQTVGSVIGRPHSDLYGNVEMRDNDNYRTVNMQPWCRSEDFRDNRNNQLISGESHDRSMWRPW